MIINSVYNALKGLNAYAPGKHKGDCLERFCVIKSGYQSPFIGTNKVGYEVIDIILFVPATNYLNIFEYKKDIKIALKKLSFLRPTGNETPAIFDNDKNAYTSSIEYQVLKKLTEG